MILGCANQAGEDNRDVARMAVLLAGFPVEVGGLTVNRLCGRGLQAVNSAAHAIAVGDGDVFIGGGVESMTRAPYVMAKPAAAWDRGPREVEDTTLGWRFLNPKLAEMYYPYSMGETAENVAERYGVDRERQDAFALESQRRAVAAIEAGRFDDQIVPVEVAGRKGETTIVTPRRASPRRHVRRGAGEAPAGVQAGRRVGHGRQQLRDQRRRVGGPARGGRARPRAGPQAARPGRLDRGRRRRPGGDGHRPGARPRARRSSAPGSRSTTSTSSS